MDHNNQPNATAQEGHAGFAAQPDSIIKVRKGLNWGLKANLIVVAAIILLVLVVGGCISSAPTSSTSAVTWNIASIPIPKSEQQQFKAAVSAANSSSVSTSITDAIVDNDWGVLYGESHSKASSTSQPLAHTVFLAHKLSSGWKVSKPEDSDFCQTLKNIPDSVLDQTSKDFFTNCFSTP